MNYKWGIFIADLNPVQGSEQKGTRPVIVVSDEDFNRLMPVVTILPVTSKRRPTGLSQRSFAKTRGWRSCSGFNYPCTSNKNNLKKTTARFNWIY